jgi:hypothetical protein
MMTPLKTLVLSLVAGFGLTAHADNYRGGSTGSGLASQAKKTNGPAKKSGNKLSKVKSGKNFGEPSDGKGLSWQQMHDGLKWPTGDNLQ